MTRKYLINQRYNKELMLVSLEGNTTSMTITLTDEGGQLYLWDTCSRSKSCKTFLEQKKASLMFTYKGDMYGKNIIGYVRLA